MILFLISTPFASGKLPLTIIHSITSADTPVVIAAAALVPVNWIKFPRRSVVEMSTAGAVKSGFIVPDALNPLPDSRNIASFRLL